MYVIAEREEAVLVNAGSYDINPKSSSEIVSVCGPTVATPPSPAWGVCCSVAIASPPWQLSFVVPSGSFCQLRTRWLTPRPSQAAFLGGFSHLGHRGGRRLRAQAQRAGAVRGP